MFNVSVHRSHRLSTIAKVCLLPTRTSGHANSASGVLKKGKIQIPCKKSWADVAVLQTLSESIVLDPLKHVQHSLYSPDFYPQTRHHYSAITSSLKHGKETSRRVRSMTPQYFELDWVECPSPQEHGGPEKNNTVDAGSSTISSDELSPSILEELIQKKDEQGVSEAYQKLAENNIDIPISTVEKAFAFVAVRACENALARVYLQKSVLMQRQSAFDQLIACVKTPTSPMLCVKLRYHALSSRYRDMVECYKHIRELGFIPDIKTVNIMLSSGWYPDYKVAENIFSTIRSCGVRPTIETFVGYILCYQSQKNKRDHQIAKEWGKLLNDIKLSGMEHCSDVYLAFLTIASKKLSNNIVSAILDIMEKKQLEAPVNPNKIDSFVDAMQFAFDTNNLALAKKVWKVASKKEYQKIMLPSGGKQEFYTLYVKIICKHDSIENATKVLVNFIPARVIRIEEVFYDIISLCKRNCCPELLPYVFTLIDTRKSEDLFYVWLQAAVNLSPNADDDTLEQFKNIAFTLYKILPSDTLGPAHISLSLLCMLIARSKDHKAIMRFLSDCQDLAASSKLSETAANEVKAALAGNPYLLKRAQTLHPIIK